jgi:hypothetical protein
MWQKTSTRVAGLSMIILMTGGAATGAKAGSDPPPARAAAKAPGADSDGVLSVSIPAGTYTVTHTERGDEISAEGFGSLLVPGKPLLPSKIFAIAIPPEAELLAVSYAAGDGVVLPGTYEVPPAPLPRVIGREDPAIYEKDRALYRENLNSAYGSDVAYPPEVVETIRTSGYRKYNLVDVRVSPFAYRPLSGSLTHYPEVTVQPGFPRWSVRDGMIRACFPCDSVVSGHFDRSTQWVTGENKHFVLNLTADSNSISLGRRSRAIEAWFPFVNWMKHSV